MPVSRSVKTPLTSLSNHNTWCYNKEEAQSLMRLFKNKWFTRYARQVGVDDAMLCQAIREVSQGIPDADLGGGVIKQRIARPGSGKSGGFRSIVLFRAGALAFFVYGFAKSERSNIGADELKAFRKLASVMLVYDEEALAIAIDEGALTEVICDEEAI